MAQVALRDKATGKKMMVWSVDAGELCASGGYEPWPEDAVEEVPDVPVPAAPVVEEPVVQAPLWSTDPVVSPPVESSTEEMGSRHRGRRPVDASS